MYLISLFLVMQLVITVGVRNGLVQGLDIAGLPIPDPCATICTPAAGVYNTCSVLTDPNAITSCVCTAQVDTEIQQCIDCVVPLQPSFASVLGPFQKAFDINCVGLPPLTFPPTTSPTGTPPTGTPTVTPSTATPSTVTTPTVTTPTATTGTPKATPPTVTTPTGTATTPSASGSSTTSASATPSSGAELSIKSQLGSMGIAIGITLLLRLL